VDKRWVLALDQGTTSSRAILFDREGRVVAVAQQEFRQRYPQPGWVEHDPEEIWATQLATAQQVLNQAGVSPADVAAIGITNQRETTVLWDRTTGKPVAPAIVWQDRRTAGMCDVLKAEGAEAVVREKTGLVLDPYFSATKIAWLLDNVPGLRARAERGEIAFGTIDSWLVYRLTGGRVHATDYSNASRTMLLNIHTLAWDDELLALFGRIPKGSCPRSCLQATSTGKPTRRFWARPFPSAALQGTSRRRCLGRRVSMPAWPRTPTAPAASSC